MVRNFFVYYECYDSDYCGGKRSGFKLETHKVPARNTGDVEAIINDLILFKKGTRTFSPTKIDLTSIKVYNNMGTDVTHYFICDSLRETLYIERKRNQERENNNK